MAEESAGSLSDELPGNLMSVKKGLLYRSELPALFVIQYANWATRTVDRVNQRLSGIGLAHFNSISDPLVLTGLHVLPAAAHVPLALAPDRPILFEPPLDVNPALKCDSEQLRVLERNHA